MEVSGWFGTKNRGLDKSKEPLSVMIAISQTKFRFKETYYPLISRQPQYQDNN